jgi:hypothetical protein
MRQDLTTYGALMIVLGVLMTFIPLVAIFGVPLLLVGLVVGLVGMVANEKKHGNLAGGMPGGPQIITTYPNQQGTLTQGSQGIILGFKYCTACGTRMPESASFCPRCGTAQG